MEPRYLLNTRRCVFFLRFSDFSIQRFFVFFCILCAWRLFFSVFLVFWKLACLQKNPFDQDVFAFHISNFFLVLFYVVQTGKHFWIFNREYISWIYLKISICYQHSTSNSPPFLIIFFSALNIYIYFFPPPKIDIYIDKCKIKSCFSNQRSISLRGICWVILWLPPPPSRPWSTPTPCGTGWSSRRNNRPPSPPPRLANKCRPSRHVESGEDLLCVTMSF